MFLEQKPFYVLFQGVYALECWERKNDILMSMTKNVYFTRVTRVGPIASKVLTSAAMQSYIRLTKRTSVSYKIFTKNGLFSLNTIKFLYWVSNHN